MADLAYEVVKDMVQVIDVCAKRGAFNGNELEGVGKLRTTLLGSVESEIKAEMEAQQAAQAAADQSEPEVE